MKKSKLSIGLVTSFIGALALTSCGSETADVTKSKSSVVSFVGYNGKTDKIEVNTDELYSEYGYSQEGVNLYYNAILEVLTRFEYDKIYESDNTLKAPSRIESEAKDKLKAVQQTAKDNAKNNGTDYDDEWDKILKSNDVKSTKALKEKFRYELQKEALSEWYFKAHSESSDPAEGEEGEHVSGLREQYLGVSKDWGKVTGKTENVDSVYPYHILHVLVKLGADKDDYVRSTITESEATKLWQVVRMLLDGKFTWSEAAKLSDDTSKDEFGDVGIMSTNTSFYNEFKLGIYAYDAILSGVNKNTAKNSDVYDAFGVGNDLNGFPSTVVTETLQQTGEKKELVEDLIYKTMADDVNTHVNNREADPADPDSHLSIPTIPFDVFKKIGEFAKEDKIGTFEPEGSAASLPRNVLFNAFLNFHSPFVITNEVLDEDSVDFGQDTINSYLYDFDDKDILKVSNHNFKNMIDVGEGTYKDETGHEEDDHHRKVLCDAEGNVVIGVRSEAGIHFMVMRKSVFEETNKKVGKEETSLLDYYTTLTPSDEGYPTGKQTYVNMKNSEDVSYYTNRANTIKSDIKSTDTFDAAYDYRIYETLLNFEIDGVKMEDRLVFSDGAHGESKLEAKIKENIDLSRQLHHENRYTTINNAWQTYLLMLLDQNNQRSDEGQFSKAFVPTTCAFRFNDANKDEWKKEKQNDQGELERGRCYVK